MIILETGRYYLLKKHSGVIRIKVHPAINENILSVILPFLKIHGKDAFADTLVIVSEHGIRRVHTGEF